ncbi:MAG: hypothetical protein R6X02_29610 [Enhygromyxa sp.]
MKRIYMFTGITAVVGGLVTAALVSSCDTECTLEARASAIVQFVDSSTGSSAPVLVPASKVWFEFSDETGLHESQRAQCLDENCTEWLLGYERPGSYVVHATVCGQEYTQTISVGMTDDGCHVDTQWIKIEVDSSTCRPDLAPADEVRTPTQCTLEARYSVLVDVVAEVHGRVQPVPTERRYFKWSGDPDQREWPGMCLDQECSQFAAGLEQEGSFEIGATVCGELFTTKAEVGKTEDGCHVATESVVLRASLDGCDEEPDPIHPPHDPACSLESRPSAIVMPVIDGGDVWIPYPTEQLWFEHGGTHHRARCAGELDQNGKCSRWITGWELDGSFSAYTETCEVITKVDYRVGKTLDGCHVETHYVPVFMDTRGCIQSPQPSADPVPVFNWE